MLPSHLIGQLAAYAKNPIEDVLRLGGRRTRPPRGEVSAVKSMTLDGFDEISQAWAPILRSNGYRMRLQSVFCHSRPQVAFSRPYSPFTPATVTNSGCCELADLLIVMDHVDNNNGRLDRRAVLIQAKMLKSGKVRLTGREWIQHELLAFHPSFTFVESGYDVRPRALAGMPLVGNPAATAEYGGILLPPTGSHWVQWLPAPMHAPLKAEISFASFLASMAVGDGLCGRKAIPGGADDWSFTVDELLVVTGSKPVVKAAPSTPRGNDNLIAFFAELPSPTALLRRSGGLGEGGDDGVPDGEGEEWGEGPISTVKMTFVAGEGDWEEMRP